MKISLTSRVIKHRNQLQQEAYRLCHFSQGHTQLSGLQAQMLRSPDAPGWGLDQMAFQVSGLAFLDLSRNLLGHTSVPRMDGKPSAMLQPPGSAAFLLQFAFSCFVQRPLHIFLHLTNIIFGHQTQLAHWLLSKVERVSLLSLFLYPVRFIHHVYWKVPFKPQLKLFFVRAQISWEKRELTVLQVSEVKVTVIKKKKIGKKSRNDSR